MTAASFLGNGRSGGSRGPRSWARLISVEDFVEFDPDAEIASPRSLEACAIEGIEPEELLYKPIEAFQRDDIGADTPEVPQMRHDFCEARRQDCLTAARAARTQLVAAENGDLDAVEPDGMSPVLVGPKNPPMDRSRSFFEKWLKLTDPFQERPPYPKDPESSAVGGASGGSTPLGSMSMPGSPTTGHGPSSPSATNANVRALLTGMLNPPSLGDTLNDPGSDAEGQTPVSRDLHAITLPSLEISMKGSAKRRDFTTTLRTTASEPVLMRTLSLMKTCPLSDRVDEEMSRKTEELLGTQKQIDERRRSHARKDEERLIKKRKETADLNFKVLMQKDIENNHFREYRQEMHEYNEEDRVKMRRGFREGLFAPGGLDDMQPPGSPSSFQGGPPVGSEKAKMKGQRVRDTHHNFYRSFHEKRNHKMEEFAADTHRRKEKFISEGLSQKMLTAQNSFEERIKWRFTYGDVVRGNEEHEAWKVQFYKDREKRQKEIAALSDNTSALRKELNGLREAHRLLTRRQVRRKAEYFKSQRKDELMKARLCANPALMSYHPASTMPI